MELDTSESAAQTAGPNYVLLGLLAVAIVSVVGVYGYQHMSVAYTPIQDTVTAQAQPTDTGNIQTTAVMSASLQGESNPFSGAPTASPLQTTVNPFATATTSDYTNPFNTQ